MFEGSSAESPKDPDKWRWLKDFFRVRSGRGATGGAQGTDGPTSPSASGLNPGAGLNEKPSLKSGASGGGTLPGKDPFKDTV